MARRRTQGRRVRSSRKITPRRWLPFVALVALTAGSVVAVRTIDPPDPVAETGPHPASFLPVAAEADAISSTWFCAAGSAMGDEGPLEMSLLVANAHEQGADAVVTLVGADGATEEMTLEVPANGRVSLKASDHLSQEWVASTVEVFGGQATVERSIRGPQGFEIAPCSSSASSDWYVPSGSTLRGAAQYLVLYNPFGGPTSVDISFATDGGPQSPQALQGVSVPPNSVRVLPIENPARQAEVSAQVTTRSGAVVVDRVQIYDGTGDQVSGLQTPEYVTEPPFGLVVTPAVPRSAPRWVFPEARVVVGGRTKLAVFNPSSVNASLTAEVVYEDRERYPEIDPLEFEVAAGDQIVVDLTDNPEVLTDVGFMLDVTSTGGVPVVADVMVFAEVSPEDYATEEDDLGEGPGVGEGEVGVDGRDPELPPDEENGEAPPDGETGETPPDDDTGEGAPDEADHDHDHDGDDEGGVVAEAPYSPEVRLARGATVLPGSPVGASTWFFAVHGQGDGRTSLMIVANPSATPVEVRAQQLIGGRRSDVEGSTVTIPGRDRRILDLTEADPIAPIVVVADGSVVASRLITGTTSEGLSFSLGAPFPDQVRLLPM